MRRAWFFLVTLLVACCVARFDPYESPYVAIGDPPAAAIFPFPTAPPLPYNSGVVNLVWVGGQSLAAGGGGSLSTIASTAGASIPPHKKLYDAITGVTPWTFWNPSIAITQGEYMYPSDPNDGGLFVNDGGNCTTGNTAEPNWVRTVGSTKTDNTCFWITLEGGTVQGPYNIDAGGDSATLQLVNESAPTRAVNASGGLSNGDGVPYPNNLIAESIDTAIITQSGLLRGGVWGAVTSAIVNANYAHIKPSGSQNAYAASLYETHAWHDNLVPANYGSGYKTQVAGIVWEHGEADSPIATVTYAGDLVAYQAQAQTDIQATTGQTQPVYMLVSPQTSSSGGLLSGGSGSMQGTIDACTGFGSKVVCFESKYAREVAGDAVHKQSGAYYAMGEKAAEALNVTLNSGGSWSSLAPTSIDCTGGGGTTCTITYPTTYGCLAYDTNLPAPHASGTFSVWAGCHGYELWKAAGTTQTCDSATITGCHTVQVVAHTADVGTIGYASVADATAPCTGCEIRSGQLQDADPFVGADAETLTCTCTNGNARVSACGAATILDNRRSLWDSVSGSGFASGTVAINRSGGTGTMDMSNTWTGSTGPCSLRWHHDMTNRGMPFQVAVGAPAAVACTDITASTSGQTSRCNGTNFIGNTTIGAAIPKVWVNGTEVTVAYISSTIIELTGNMPTLAAGAYLVEVQNPYGVRTSFSNAINALTSGGSTDTWSSIWNLNCRGGGDNTSIVGSPATTWTDLCGFKKDLAAFAGSAGLTVTATDANFNNKTSVTFNGTNDDMQVSSFPTAATAGDAVMMIIAARLLNTTNAKVLFANNTTGALEFQRNGTNARFVHGSLSATWTGTDPLNLSKGWYGWTPGGSGTQQDAVSINNGTFVLSTGAAINTTQTSNILSLGSRASASIPTNFSAAAWAQLSFPQGTTLASLAPQLARTEAMFVSRFGVSF